MNIIILFSFLQLKKYTYLFFYDKNKNIKYNHKYNYKHIKYSLQFEDLKIKFFNV